MNQLTKGTKDELKEHKGLSSKIRGYKLSHGRLPSDKKLAELIAKDHLKKDKGFYR